MKTMKKVLAFMLALAMVVTAVPVTNAEAATGLPKSKSYYAGKTYTLKLTTPKSWKSVSTVWSATNNNTKAVAISDKKAKSVTVKALKKGKAVVTAKVTYKKSGVKTTKTYKCNVRVKAPTITITQKAITVEVDKTANITTKFVPASATVSFESENNTIATVKDLGNGKAVVTGVTPGQSTNIKAYLRCGKKVKMSIVKVTVTGEDVVDGLTGRLMNSLGEYPDTVATWNTDPNATKAVIRFRYVKGGVGVEDKSIYVEREDLLNGGTTSMGTHKTDANGYVQFNDDSYGVDKYKYTATAIATGEKADITVSYGLIKNSDVKVYNLADNSHKNEGFPKLVVSENDKNGGYGDGITATDGTYTYLKADGNEKELMYTTEFVDSQQVSLAGTTDNQVGFKGGLPVIVLPGEGSKLNAALPFNKSLDLASGEYGTYATKTLEVFDLGVNPNELTWAQLEVASLKLSEYTKLTITAYKDAACTKKLDDIYTVNGAYSKENFVIPIKLTAGDVTNMFFKVVITSQGQVNTELNKGIKLTGITGVYKDKVSAVNNKTEILKGAKITWSDASKPSYGPEKEISKLYADTLFVNKAANVDFTSDKVAKVTYCEPAFPYTGNAIIKTYDKNGVVLAYYACPTINNGRNVNVIDTSAQYCYQISEDEATKAAGKITSQNGDFVVVNSEKAGLTTLVGTITGVEGLDATNSKVYTSVQWCPRKNQAAGRDAAGAIAFKGQNLIVTAQLVDKNENPVSTANEEITFKYKAGTTETQITQAMKGTSLVAAHGVNPVVVSIETKTDTKGQAKLVLKATDVSTLVGIKASSDNYEVKINIGELGYKEVDAYWVDAYVAFTDTAVGTATTKSSKDVTKVTKADVEGLNPKAGETWDYGYYVVADPLNKGIWDGKAVTVLNAKIGLKTGSDSVGVAKFDTGVNGMAQITSTKAGDTKLVGSVDGTPETGKKIEFQVKDHGTQPSCGDGTTGVDSKLELDITWQSVGVAAEFVNINGYKAVSSSPYTLYLRVADKHDNALKDEEVSVKVADGTLVSVGGTPGAVSGTTNAKGIIAIQVNPATPTPVNKSVVTVTVASLDNAIITKEIEWVDAASLKVVTKNKLGEVATRAVDNKITLTFSEDILATSVDKKMFTVKYNSGTIEVTNVEVIGNKVVLTLTHGAAKDNVAKPYVVSVVNTQTNADGVPYILTAVNGVCISTGEINVFSNEVVPDFTTESVTQGDFSLVDWSL